MDRTIKSSNKVPGCENYTRPEEIEALSKYLGEIKSAQENYISEQERIVVGGVYVPNIKSLSSDLEKLVDNISPGLTLNNSADKLPNDKGVDELSNYSESIEVSDVNLNPEIEELEINRIKELNSKLESIEVPTDKLNSVIEELSVPNNKLSSGFEKLEVPESELKKDIIDLDVPLVELNSKTETLDVPSDTLKGNIENLEVPKETLKKNIEELEVSEVESLGGVIEELNPTQELALKNYVDELSIPKDVDLSKNIIGLSGVEETPLSSGFETLDIQKITELSKKLETLDGKTTDTLSANIEWLTKTPSPPELSSDFANLNVEEDLKLDKKAEILSGVEEISLGDVLENLFVDEIEKLSSDKIDLGEIEDIQLNPDKIEIETPKDKLNPVREDIEVPKDKLNPVRENIEIPKDELNPVRENIEVPKDKLNPTRIDVEVPKDKLNPTRIDVEVPKDKLNPVREDIEIPKDELNPVREDIEIPKDKLNPVREDITVPDPSLNPKREDIPENKTPGPRDDEELGTPTSIPTEIVDEAKKIKNVFHDGPEDIKLDSEGNLDGVHKSIREEDKKQEDDPNKTKETSKYIKIDDYSSPLNAYGEIDEDDLTSYISNNLEKSKYIKIDEGAAKPLNNYDEIDEDDLTSYISNNLEKSKYIKVDEEVAKPLNAYDEIDEDDLTSYISNNLEKSKYIKVDEKIAKPLNAYDEIDEDDLVGDSAIPEKLSSAKVDLGEDDPGRTKKNSDYVDIDKYSTPLYPVGIYSNKTDEKRPENNSEHDTYFDPTGEGAGLYEGYVTVDDNFDYKDPDLERPLEVYERGLEDAESKTAQGKKRVNEISTGRFLNGYKISGPKELDVESGERRTDEFFELNTRARANVLVEHRKNNQRETSDIIETDDLSVPENLYDWESLVAESEEKDNKLESLRVLPYNGYSEKYVALMDYLKGSSDETEKVIAALCSTYLLPPNDKTGEDLPASKAEEFEAKLIKEAEAATLLEYKLPSTSIFDVNIGSYIRFAAEKLVGVTKLHGTNRQLLLDETIATLIYLRNLGEQKLKTERSHLPGAKLVRLKGKLGSALTGPFTDSIITNLSQGSIRKAMSGATGSVKDAIFGSKWQDRQKNPVNYPQTSEEEETTFDYPEPPAEDASEKVEAATKEKSKGLKAAAKKMFGGLVNKLKEKAKVLADLNKDGEGGMVWNERYYRGGVVGTYETEDFLEDSLIFATKSLPAFFSRLENNKYFTSYKKFEKLTLDTNNYWEVRLDPYLNGDNGNLSFLPGIHEINIENYRRHNAITNYNGWIPLTSIDVQLGRLSSKSLQLFDGESFYPTAYEMANELRLTISDDIYKSWRRYFEKCMYVSLFPSLAHDKDFYEDKEGETVIAMQDKTNFTIAMYKNITFRCRVLVMTPQLTASRVYDLLVVLKDFSEDFSGDTEGGGADLNVTFSIVGEVTHEKIEINQSKGLSLNINDIGTVKAPYNPLLSDMVEGDDLSSASYKAAQSCIVASKNTLNFYKTTPYAFNNWNLVGKQW